MKKIFIFLAIVVVIVAVFVYKKNGVNSKTSNHFKSEAYHVELDYPKEWKVVGGVEEPRYEGESGYFEVSAAGG